MEKSNMLFYSSKFPWSWERISSKFIGNLGPRLQNVRPAPPYISPLYEEGYVQYAKYCRSVFCFVTSAMYLL